MTKANAIGLLDANSNERGIKNWERLKFQELFYLGATI